MGKAGFANNHRKRRDAMKKPRPKLNVNDLPEWDAAGCLDS